jgi:transposase
MTTKKKSKTSPESIVREIKRRTRRKFTAEEKIRIVLEGLRGEESITDICRKEGIHPTMYYKWSKSFLESGKRLFFECGESSSAIIKNLLNFSQKEF